MKRLLTCVLVLLTLCAPAVRGEPPEVFDKRAYPEAKKAAEEGKKWFVVKATAEWCGPCKQMDKTTWHDEKVVAWVKKNGVAVTVDVDKEPKLAEELRIEAMPTMIAFKDGKEFDRIVGYRSPADFLEWLEGIGRGEKSIEAVKRRAAPKEGVRQDIKARLDLADRLAQSGKGEEAAAEYVWLWEHMLEHDPAMYGVRLSFMVADMEELAAANKAARKMFTELRDKAAKELEKEKVAPDEVVDWVALNRVLGDGEATLKWFDRVKGEARWRALVSRVSRDLAALFVETRRWADLGRLYADPIAELERDHSIMLGAPETALPADLDEATREHIRDIPARLFREKAGRLYAGLLAAGRETEAEKFAARARELYSKPELVQTMIETALEAGQARAQHIGWIDGAAVKTAALKALKPKVQRALEGTEAK